MPADLPVTRDGARKIAEWLDAHFGDSIERAIDGKPYTVALVHAIACKETGPMLVAMIDALPPEEVLGYCVFDASGDAPQTRRSAFPVNTAAFRAAYGEPLTRMLIDEANAARVLRGLPEAEWVYKGYGPFQYDLQHIRADEAFFAGKQWYGFDACLERLVAQLDEKLRRTGNDLGRAIVAYNGSGPRAREYGRQVQELVEVLTA